MLARRRARRPVTLRDHLARAARWVMVVWLALALAGVTLAQLPVNIGWAESPSTAEGPRHP